MNIFDLISSVGGTLGLFIGVSFLILVEMLEIILESFLTKLTNINKKEKKRNAKENQNEYVKEYNIIQK